MTRVVPSARSLSPEMVVRGYCAGAFPMARGREAPIEWFSPDPRALLPLSADRFHVPRSLGRRVRSGRFRVSFDAAFEQVIRACAAPRGAERETWISEPIVAAYTALHHAGLAHSVEAWQRLDTEAGADDADESDRAGPLELVGGLYGVALGGAFFGESMFSRRADASKVCLVKLVEHLRERGFALLDVQFSNPHLEQFGLYELPRATYLERLYAALEMEVAW